MPQHFGDLSGHHFWWQNAGTTPIPTAPVGDMPRLCKGGSSLVELFNEKILWTYGYESKPCTPGEHQNSWYMDVHPPRYSKIGFDTSPILWLWWTMVKSWYMREILQKTCRFTMFYHGFYQKPSTTSLGRGPWNCASSEVLDPGSRPFPHEDIATHKPF